MLKCFVDTLKEILREIDNKLSEEDLDGIIEEVDDRLLAPAHL